MNVSIIAVFVKYATTLAFKQVKDFRLEEAKELCFKDLVGDLRILGSGLLMRASK